MGIFLNTAKADGFSYLDETGKNRPVQLLKTDRQKPVRTGRFNFIDRTRPVTTLPQIHCIEVLIISVAFPNPGITNESDIYLKLILLLFVS
jgi:hypothetical protein